MIIITAAKDETSRPENNFSKREREKERERERDGQKIVDDETVGEFEARVARAACSLMSLFF